MNNTRFATQIHILSLLALKTGEWLSSDFIAGSIEINPVVVRREIAILKKHKLLDSRKGKDGGVQLMKKSQDIRLGEIFEIVKNGEVLGKKNQHPNPNCPVGKDINQALGSLFNNVDKLIFEMLNQISLAQFVKENFINN